MAEFSDELDALFNKNSPSNEQPLAVQPSENSSSSVVATTTSTMQNPPVPPNTTTTTIDQSSNQRPLSPLPNDPLISTDNQFVFMPTPSLLPISCSMNHPTTTTTTTTITIPDLGMSSTSTPYPDPQQQYNPLSDYMDVNMNNLLQAPYMDHQEILFNQTPSYWNTKEDPLDPNWEAISAYLAGQVRPGIDGDRIFRCNTCGVEFPNAQAFGGHMSSHSKTKKEKILAPSKGRLKKVAGSKKSKSFAVMEEVKAMKGGTASAGRVNKVEDDNNNNNSKGKDIKCDEGYESEESVSSELVVKDQSSTTQGQDE